MATSMPVFTMNNGLKMPQIGFGTFDLNPVAESVMSAIDIGYRHFDMAWLYGNEQQLGDVFREAIKQGKVKREDLFLTTKIWVANFDRVRESFMESLSHLQVEYVDLLLVHFPTACKGPVEPSNPFLVNDKGEVIFSDKDYTEVYKEMETFVDEGLVKSLGVSNFNHKQLQRILDLAKYKPVVNQIEVHPYFARKKIIKWCKENDVLVACYSQFGAPNRSVKSDDEPVVLLKHPTVKAIADKYQKTPAQILLRFSLDRGCAVLPKSQTPKRMKENLEALTFKLGVEDIELLEELDRNWMAYTVNIWKRIESHPHYPFNEDF